MISLNRSLYFSVYLLFSLFSNPSQGNDFIAIGSCGDTQSKNYRNIAEVQGAFTDPVNVKHWPSPFINQWVVVEGIVILDKTKEYQGFWLQ